MKIRKLSAVLGTVVIFLCCIVLYRMADRSLFPQDNAVKEFPSNNWVHVQDVKTEVKPTIPRGIHGGKLIAPKKTSEKPESVDKTCVVPSNDADADIQMLEVFKELRFDNPDGGVWKQGWNVKSDPTRWNPQNRLKVFVVPHSHNDPGWVKTFDDYYTSSTRNILNSMLEKMTSDQRKRFIWAEVSYFALWWDELSVENQRKAKRLVENGQLEIVTGGWVMNDEANSHFYSILMQLTEGHHWVKDNLNVLPKNSWCIDPFGTSASMPYILKHMGLNNLVIQRIHYSIKKYFSQTKNLEFRWRQLWDNGGNTDFFTHMMPFYSYDVPHTCGPDPKVCCQFDFKRLPGHGLSCPWKEPPRQITSKNVAARAELLLDQYRKKAELYRTNVILVPLGDDFRYEYDAEWEYQFNNYYKIFEHFNSHPELNVYAKFGTLEEFFNELLTESSPDEFPSLHGDFFTYADRDDHYWSGYFTSRPFHKRMDRVLMGYLRSAEMVYALAWSLKPHSRSNWLLAPTTGMVRMLRDARRSLSLFQHHDGITGTARDHVMEDYGRRMMEAIGYCQQVLQQSVHFLLSPRGQAYEEDADQVYFDVDDHRRNQNSLPERKLLIFRVGESKRIVFFNSLARRRQEVVSIHVFSHVVSITDGSGTEVPCQSSPVFTQGSSSMDNARYEISFIADVPAMGIASYTVTLRASVAETRENSLAKVTVLNSFGTVKTAPGFESTTFAEAREFSIETTKMKAAFSNEGQLKSVTLKDTGVTVPVHIDFLKYMARKGTERSGAYLFLPAGEAVLLRGESPVIRLIEGPLVSRAEVLLPNIRHTVTFYSSSGVDGYGLEISNLVDISKENNYELVMRLSSHVRSLDEFYTDLNGLQMIKRKRFAKIPLQGNFYPFPQAAYIEDDNVRITLTTAQPLGIASLKEGQLEVVQDRRLQQDDNRGLGQGVLDNRPTVNTFRLLVEQRSCKGTPSLLSERAYGAVTGMLNPMLPLLWRPETPCSLDSGWAPGQEDLPLDVELLSVRTLENDSNQVKAGLVFHRTHVDSCFMPATTPATDGAQINIDRLMPDNFGVHMNKTLLSFLGNEVSRSRKDDLPLCHMDLLALVIER